MAIILSFAAGMIAGIICTLYIQIFKKFLNEVE